MTQPPSVSGVTEVGETLTASTGEWLGTGPLTYAYQWFRCESSGGGCVTIAGATASSYLLGEDSLGSTLRVQVTASNTVGIVSALSDPSAVVTAPPAALTAPTNSDPPAVSGVLESGETVTASSGAWSGSEPISFSYQWQRCDALGSGCSDIAGATGTTYTLTDDLIGATLRVRVTAANAVGTVAATSPASTPVTVAAPALEPPPANTSPPTLEGTAEVGQTLTAHNGTWTGAEPIAYAHQWLRCGSAGGSCVEIAGATGATRTLTDASLNATVRVRVTASNTAGSTSALSDPSATVAAAATTPAAEPPANETAPSISGVLQVGETAAASTGVWRGAEPISYAYQWLHCSAAGSDCVAIAGATAAELALTPDLEGATLVVRVTATDGAGSTSATSPVSAPIAPAVPAAVAPANTSPPSISGVLETGQMLTASTGLWTGTAPLTYSYQWLRCDSSGGACVDIDAAANATLTLTTDLLGSSLKARVTARNAGGSTDALSQPTAAVTEPAPGKPVNTSLPTISGETQVGETLTASTGTWSGIAPVSYTFQWLRCDSSGSACTAIAGATAATYTLDSTLLGATLRVQVTATDSAGSTSATSHPTAPVETAPVASEPPLNVRPPTISGVVESGERLTASAGLWTGTAPITYGYQWLRCTSDGQSCAAIAGATETTYTLTAGDRGSTLRVDVTATNSAGTAGARSPATTPVIEVTPAPPASTSPPEISGVIQAGQTVHASTGTWTATPPVSYNYQWLRCNASGGSCSELGGATGSTLLLSDTMVGATLRVRVTATDSAGSATARSAATATVAAAPTTETHTPPANTAAPGISGVVRAGQTLTAAEGDWTGTAPLTYGYQWLHCQPDGTGCETIADATARTYTVPDSALGASLRVGITAHNIAGSRPATSPATSPVAAGPAPPLNTTPPAISGEAQAGQPLTASAGSWVGTPPLSYRYQWLRCDGNGANCTPITWATSATYTPPGDLSGATLRVRVTATDANGSTDATSAAAGPVIAAAVAEFPSSEGVPTLSGSAHVGGTLTASTGAWTGAAPITYSYQWLRCDGAGTNCRDIAGATTATLALTADMAGETIRVRVTARNDGGSESALSPLSPPILDTPAIESSLPPPVASPPDGATVPAVARITFITAQPVKAVLRATLDGNPVSVTLTGNTVTIATGGVAPGLHTISGVLEYADGTQQPFTSHLTVAPASTANATARVGDPSASTAIALPPGGSAQLPAGAVEPTGDGDRLVLTMTRFRPGGNSPPGIALPIGTPAGLAHAGDIYAVTLAWERAETRVTALAKPLRITIRAQTTTTPSAPAGVTVVTAPSTASRWQTVPACSKHGQLAPAQTACYWRATALIHILTRHLSLFAVLRPQPLAASWTAPKRIPLYRRRFIPARITLTRAAEATLTLRSRAGRVIRRAQRTLPAGKSTLLLRRLPAHPFPRSGRYTLTLTVRSGGQTGTSRRTIRLIRSY